MAFLMKSPHGDSKGILVFTHKERDIVELRDPALDRLFDQVRSRYVTAMHWGHYAQDVAPLRRIDVHLAAPGTVTFSGQVRRIPLASRNFISDSFRDRKLPKVWDVIVVARPLRLKRLGDLLEIVRRAYDTGERVRVLALCPRPETLDEPDWHSSLWTEYITMFTAAERADFVLLLIGPEGYPFPLSEDAVASAYNLAKAFALLSEQEGESRVVAEALLCGLHVIARDDVRGGAADYLTAANSLRYGDLNEAAAAFISVAKGELTPFATDELREELGEEESTNRLLDEFRRVFLELGIPFEGPVDTEDLARKLPGHRRLLAENVTRRYTDDLRSTAAAADWLGGLVGEPMSARNLVRLQLLERSHALVAKSRARGAAAKRGLKRPKRLS